MRYLILITLIFTSIFALADQVTIYNNNLALVRTNIELPLNKGVQDVLYDGITSGIQPQSVIVRPLKSTFAILSQNYEYDMANTASIIKKYIGKEISVSTEDASFTGILQYSDSQTIGLLENTTRKLIMVNADEVQHFTLAELPDNFFLKPTLHWLISAPKKGNYKADFSYLSHGFTWEVTYNGVWDATKNQLVITPWVTLNNTSGKAFEDVELKLMAGELNTSRSISDKVSTRSMKFAMQEEQGFKEKSFHDYHLYTLGRKVDLANNQLKQIQLFAPASATATSLYTYQTNSNAVISKIRFYNKKESNLGMPLPAGVFKIYQLDAQDNNLQFIGEDRIGHTPKNEEVVIATGSAFDLVGTTTQLDTRKISRTVSETDYKVTLKNRSEDSKTIVVTHKLWGQWSIFKNNEEFTQKDANTIEFEITIKPDAETNITWTERHE